MATSTAAEVRATGQKWLEAPPYTLLVSPYPALQPGQSSLDRNVVPPLGEPPDVTFPKVQRATLSNGLKVMLLERHSSALVNVALAVDAGYAADSAEKAGAASLALDLLDDGTTTRDTFRIADELDAIGARISTGSSLDLSFVRLQALSSSLAPGARDLRGRRAAPVVPAGDGGPGEEAAAGADRPGEGDARAGRHARDARRCSTAPATATAIR